MPYFARFVVQDKNLRKHDKEGGDKSGAPKIAPAKEYEDIELWEGLDPEGNLADQLILYEVARRRYPGTENDLNFSQTDESSDNNDHDSNEDHGNDNDAAPPPTSSSALLERGEYKLNASYKAKSDILL